MTHRLLPVEVALGPKDHLDPQLSPDGTLVSYLAPLDGVSNVWVLDVRTGQRRPVTNYDSDPIGGMFSYVSALGRSVWHRWCYDGQHLLHLRDRGGNEAFHVHAVDLTTGASRDLTPHENIQAVLAGLSPDRPDLALVQMGAEDPSRLDLHTLRISDGHTEDIVRNPGFDAWIVDRDLQVVGGIAQLDDGGHVVRARTSAGGWLDVFHQDPTAGPLSVFGTDHRGRAVLVTADGGDTARVLLLDLTNGATTEGSRRDGTVDVHSPVPHPRTGEIDITRVSRERTVNEAVDPVLEDELRRLQAHNPDGEALLVSRTLEDTTWLVELSHDNAPLDYALWDRPTQSLRMLFSHLDALRHWPLARQEPLTFTSSDGLTIHGYVMAPPHLPRTNLPTVVLVHGGPAQRQLWGWGDPYIPFAQWFASRGYLVLLIDYRGSNGYGTHFLRAINREWGGRSLSDLLEAVDYAATQGWADPDRVAFWGASFGGYTALAAAAFAGDRIRCSVPIAGISNLLSMVQSVPPYWKGLRRHWVEVLGDPDTESEFLWSRSPLSRADQIDVPLLLIHGKNDPRCTAEESAQMVTALQARGIDVQHLEFADEGHVFTQPESWRRALDATERFFERHLQAVIAR